MAMTEQELDELCAEGLRAFTTDIEYLVVIARMGAEVAERREREKVHAEELEKKRAEREAAASARFNREYEAREARMAARMEQQRVDRTQRQSELVAASGQARPGETRAGMYSRLYRQEERGAKRLGIKMTDEQRAAIRAQCDAAFPRRYR